MLDGLPYQRRNPARAPPLHLFCQLGALYRRQYEEQVNQASCRLNLLTNAVVIWNTAHITALLEQLKKEGLPVAETDIVYLSLARYEHINPYGKYQNVNLTDPGDEAIILYR